MDDITYRTQPWNDLYARIADELDRHEINLDRVYFITTPNHPVFITEDRKNILEFPASYYVRNPKRRVLIDKFNVTNAVNNFKTKIDLGPLTALSPIYTKHLSAGSYRMTTRMGETIYDALRRFMNDRKQYYLFFYVYDEMLNHLHESNIIRLAMWDLT